MAFFESHPDRNLLFRMNIVGSWNGVIPETAGQGEKFLEGVDQAVKGLNIPGLMTFRKELETMKEEGKARGKHLRAALLVRSDDEPMNHHNIYFSSQDFGKHLILSQYIERKQASHYSPYESEVLAAYFGLVKAAMMNVVKQITTEAQQDFSKINTQSTGVIDIA